MPRRRQEAAKAPGFIVVRDDKGKDTVLFTRNIRTKKAREDRIKRTGYAQSTIVDHFPFTDPGFSDIALLQSLLQLGDDISNMSRAIDSLFSAIGDMNYQRKRISKK